MMHIQLTERTIQLMNDGVPFGMEKDLSPWIIEDGKMYMRHDTISFEDVGSIGAVRIWFWWRGFKVFAGMVEGVRLLDNDMKPSNLQFTGGTDFAGKTRYVPWEGM